MHALSQNRNADPQRNDVNQRGGLTRLVASLRETERALWENITSEEQRTNRHDPNDPLYSILARSLRARLDNLKQTIATLEARRVAA
jgi:hypothetical protein